jgi:hypothetical protein
MGGRGEGDVKAVRTLYMSVVAVAAFDGGLTPGALPALTLRASEI